MKESQFLTELENRARAESLVQVLQTRFKSLPDDLRDAILATNNQDRLFTWLDLAVTARTLKSFRKKAGV